MASTKCRFWNWIRTRLQHPAFTVLPLKPNSPARKGAPEYICPTEIEPALERKLQTIGLQAHIVLSALDISRVDIRLDITGNPQLMEINPLPGLTLGYSDICVQAAAEGIDYEDLILEILYLAAGRWGMLKPRVLPT